MEVERKWEREIWKEGKARARKIEKEKNQTGDGEQGRENKGGNLRGRERSCERVLESVRGGRERERDNKRMGGESQER